MKLTEAVENDILYWAETQSPSEMCGFVLESDKQVFFLAKNVSDRPSETFEIDIQSWIDAEKLGEISAIVHSHPCGEPYLSGADRQMQVRTGLPWVLAAGGELKQFRCCPHLRGREFKYGVFDCFTLVRDAFHLMGIDFRDHPRAGIDDDAAADSFVKNLPDGGFVRVATKSIQVGDVILTLTDGHAAHAMLYLGGGMVLHHAYGSLSRRQNYGEYLRQMTHSVWRHREFKTEMLRAVTNDLVYSE